jgi:hypothetical protein
VISSFGYAYKSVSDITNWVQQLRVCFKNQKRADFLWNLIGLFDEKAHENEISY